MLPAFNMFLGRSSQRQHVGVFSGASLKPSSSLGVSLLFEDIRTKQGPHRATRNAAMSEGDKASDIANRTFAIVKPDALTPFKYQQIDALIKLNEFQVVRQKLVWLSRELADALFPARAKDPDYQEWIDYITCAPCMALELAKENATLFWQLTMGLDEFDDGPSRDSDSIRGILAIDRLRNAVDGSEEPEDAEKQLALVFSDEVAELPYDNFLMQHSVDAHSTLALIKPDIAQNTDAVALVIRRITGRGYAIRDRVEIHLSRAQAAAFYEEHAGKPFFDDLVAFMSSGPIIALLVEGDDVIRGWRTMIGPTSPEAARAQVPQSIRAMLGADGPRNAVHGSDSVQGAQRELNFFFHPKIQPEPNVEPEPEPEPDPVPAAAANGAADDEEKKKKKKKPKRRNKRKQTVSAVDNEANVVAAENANANANTKPAETTTTTTTTAVPSDDSDDEPAAESGIAEQPSESPSEGPEVKAEAKSDTIVASQLVEQPSEEGLDKAAEQAVTDESIESIAENPVAEEPVEETVAEPALVSVSEPVEAPVDEPAEDSVPGPAQETVPEADVQPEESDPLAAVNALLKPYEPVNQRTFALIKPDAYPRYQKQIIKTLIEKGFTVVAQQEVQLTTEVAETIYSDMKTYPVFQRIIDSATSGPVLALVLEGADAIAAWRSLVGPTNPKSAKIEACNSLRAKYGVDVQRNAVHASKDESDVLNSTNAVFFDLLGGNFKTLEPTDDPLALIASSEPESAAGSVQSTPQTVPAANLAGPETPVSAEEPSEHVEQVPAEETAIADVPVTTEAPATTGEPASAVQVENNAEVLATVVEPDPAAVEETVAAIEESAVAVVEPASDKKTNTDIEPEPSKIPDHIETPAPAAESVAAEIPTGFDKPEPEPEPVADTAENKEPEPDTAQSSKTAPVSSNDEPSSEAQPTQLTPPQTKTSAFEKATTPFGKRLASSPFLQADRQLAQETPVATKKIGRIKSPFLKSDASDNQSTPLAAAAAAAAAVASSSPPTSVRQNKTLVLKEADVNTQTGKAESPAVAADGLLIEKNAENTSKDISDMVNEGPAAISESLADEVPPNGLVDSDADHKETADQDKTSDPASASTPAETGIASADVKAGTKAEETHEPKSKPKPGSGSEPELKPEAKGDDASTVTTNGKPVSSKATPSTTDQKRQTGAAPPRRPVASTAAPKARAPLQTSTSAQPRQRVAARSAAAVQTADSTASTSRTAVRKTSIASSSSGAESKSTSSSNAAVARRTASGVSAPLASRPRPVTSTVTTSTRAATKPAGPAAPATRASNALRPTTNATRAATTGAPAPTRAPTARCPPVSTAASTARSAVSAKSASAVSTAKPSSPATATTRASATSRAPVPAAARTTRPAAPTPSAPAPASTSASSSQRTAVRARPVTTSTATSAPAARRPLTKAGTSTPAATPRPATSRPPPPAAASTSGPSSSARAATSRPAAPAASAASVPRVRPVRTSAAGAPASASRPAATTARPSTAAKPSTYARPA
ncbi:hypothetical protein FB639_000953, partial [Coemansia asiatica]